MNVPQQLAKHLRGVYFGRNYTGADLKTHVSDLTWQQAVTPIHNCNTIAALVYHIRYYVRAVLQVLGGGPLDAHDQYSFDLPLIESQEDWQQLLHDTWTDAEDLAVLVEGMEENRLWETFADPKYGSNYRNIQGVIEHTHYHLGQIVLLKKMLP